MHDRTFVGGDGVGAMLERGFEVLDGGLAGLEVERTGFEDYVGAGTVEPFANIARGLCLLQRGPVIVEDSQRVEAVGIGEPAAAACGDTREAPADVIAAAEFDFFGDELANESAADIAEADDREIVGWNGASEISRSILFDVSFGWCSSVEVLRRSSSDRLRITGS
jgi:hypothetical protein